MKNLRCEVMAQIRQDARKAKTLDEASLNSDGKTYNGARALSWLSEVLTDGKGLSEEEVKAVWEDVKTDAAKRGEKR